MHNAFDRLHTQPVASVYGGRSPLGLSDEVLEEMRLWIVQPLYASFRHNAAVIGSHDQTRILLEFYACNRVSGVGLEHGYAFHGSGIVWLG